MVRLIEKIIDPAASMGLFLFFKQPAHAIDEGRGPGEAPDLLQGRKKLPVAIRNDVLSATNAPVARRMHDAAAPIHPQRQRIRVERAGGHEVDLDAQSLPAMNLMIEFRIGAADTRRVTDDVEVFNHETVRRATKEIPQLIQ